MPNTALTRLSSSVWISHQEQNQFANLESRAVQRDARGKCDAKGETDAALPLCLQIFS